MVGRERLAPPLLHSKNRTNCTSFELLCRDYFVEVPINGRQSNTDSTTSRNELQLLLPYPTLRGPVILLTWGVRAASADHRQSSFKRYQSEVYNVRSWLLTHLDRSSEWANDVRFVLLTKEVVKNLRPIKYLWVTCPKMMTPPKVGPLRLHQRSCSNRGECNCW